MTAPAPTRRPPRTTTVAGFPVTVWDGPGHTVVGLAGLGSGGLSWAPIAARVPDATVVSMDLRGRGAAQGMTGPTGLRAHAHDVARVLADLDLADVTVVGHSMGAYLAPLVAQEAAGRVRDLVLVDGGIRPAFPALLRPWMTALLFRTELRRADRTFPDLEALVTASRVEPMLASRPDLRAEILDTLRAELAETPAGLRPRLDVSRAVADAVDTFFGGETERALAALTVPAVAFLAEHRKADTDKPFIADAAVTPWLQRQPLLTVRRLPGNHVTVLYAPEVAQACARRAAPTR